MVGDHEGWRAITFRNAHHAIFFFGPRATTVPVTGVTAMHLLDHTRWYYYVCVVCVCVHCALDLALIWHRDIRYGAAPTLTHRNTRKCARFGLWMGGCGQGQSSLVYWICHYYYIQHVLHGHSPIFPQKVCVTEWGAPKRFGGVVWWWDKHTFRVRMHPSETLVWLGGVAKKAIDTNVQRPAL